MQMLTFALLGLGGLASAAPTLLPRDVSATQYQITTLKTHFMGTNSGIGDGSWPAGTEFPSTIELAVKYPAAAGSNASSTSCTASWTYGTHPTDWIVCEDKDVAWKFTEFTTEAKFTIEIGRNTGETSAETGSVSVVSNDFSSDDSWLTCLGGAPTTGIHCDLDGVMSTQKSPIPVAVTSGPAIGPF